jgi:hypothetical protein
MDGARPISPNRTELEGECIRPGTPLSLGEGGRLVQGYIEHYNVGH